jgi:hypothetical protein
MKRPAIRYTFEGAKQILEKFANCKEAAFMQVEGWYRQRRIHITVKVRLKQWIMETKEWTKS